ncbi:MAG: PilZ domain-containing protein [Marinagarivorans sp.]|nr:PilZ domain-containing protein [Marinagarivorans sp.]
MEERRRFTRTSAAIRVELTNPAFGTLVGSTCDLSDGGAQVQIDNELIPPVGTLVEVIFKRIVGTVNENPVTMRVMHTHKNLVGLMFVAR